MIKFSNNLRKTEIKIENTSCKYIKYGMHQTQFGDCLFAVNENDAICNLSFIGDMSYYDLISLMKLKMLGSTFIEDKKYTLELFSNIVNGNETKVNLAVIGTNLQLAVWDTLINKVPFGETCSYEQVAKFLDQPSGLRAIASAIAKNYISFFIPCHRVVRKNNSIGKYRWGVSLKRSLLDWEKKTINETPISLR